MRIFSTFCLILICFACKDEVAYQPVLSDDDIIEMLIDMHTSEAALSRIPKKEIDSTRMVYLDMIFNKYHIDEVAHGLLMNHLKKNPVQLSELYKTVFDSLEARGSRIKVEN